ncbi:MAG: hypothetical protein WC962_01000 [Phycisphaerae bacterium]|jgi:predicted PurR-regulated permease PerM
MKTRRNFAFLSVILLACAAFFWLATSHGVEKEIEVQTYSLPEYRSDTARAIDAYQQMINRMLDDNQQNWANLQQQLNTINAKLDKIQSDIDGISRQIGRIEEKMGIEDKPEENQPSPGELQQPKMTNTK